MRSEGRGAQPRLLAWDARAVLEALQQVVLKASKYLVGISAAVLAIILAAWTYQNHFIFEPDPILHAKPADFSFHVVSATVPVSAPNASSATLNGWWIPSARAGAKVILYFHGNDGNLSTSMQEVALLRPLEYSIFMVDYRGFGESRGSFPSEKTVYEDAEVAWSYLNRTRGVAPAEIFICGHSLGGAIAIELALHHPEAGGLIVESSFTSIYDMAMLRRGFSLLPMQTLLNQRFDSLNKVPRLRLPALYVHGTADEIVPVSMGMKLFAASGGKKRFLAVDDAHHDDINAIGGPKFLEDFRSFVEDSADQRNR